MDAYMLTYEIDAIDDMRRIRRDDCGLKINNRAEESFIS